VCPARPKRAPGPQNTAYSRQTMSQNHRPAAPAIDLTKKSSLFEVPYSREVIGAPDQKGHRRNSSASRWATSMSR
jgi:hypothetical protein